MMIASLWKIKAMRSISLGNAWGKTLNQPMRASPGFPALMEETNAQMTKPRKAEGSAVVTHLVLLCTKHYFCSPQRQIFILLKVLVQYLPWCSESVYWIIVNSKDYFRIQSWKAQTSGLCAFFCTSSYIINCLITISQWWRN